MRSWSTIGSRSNPLGQVSAPSSTKTRAKNAGSLSGRTISPSRAVVGEKSCTPDEPSEKATRNVKPPTGFTETTSIIGACDSEAAAVRLRMMPVLHQLGMPEFHPISYQFRLLPGKPAADDFAVADPHQCLCAGIDRMHVRRIVIFKEHLNDNSI